MRAGGFVRFERSPRLQAEVLVQSDDENGSVVVRVHDDQIVIELVLSREDATSLWDALYEVLTA